MSLAEGRRKQTFELEAKRVRNRRQVRGNSEKTLDRNDKEKN